MKTRPLILASSLLLFGGVPSLGAQLIRGSLLAEDDRGVEGAEIALLTVSGAALMVARSDSAGGFMLSAPEPGVYVITATRIGLAPVRAQVDVGEKEVVEIELRTTAEAIPLEPLVVVGRRPIRQGTLEEFYDRMERMKQKGWGFFFTREELEQWERTEIAMMLENAPGVMAWPSEHAGYVIRMAGHGGRCSPDVYLDGFPVAGAAALPSLSGEGPRSRVYPFGSGSGSEMRPRYSDIQVMDLEGVEVYRGRHEAPGGYWPSDCGAIFLWRKRDFGHPFSWKKVFLAGGMTAAVVFLGKLIF